MHRLEIIGWIGTAAALGICGIAARMWTLAFGDLRFTKEQIRLRTMTPRDAARVVARWNFTTASVHLFFAIVLIWILIPGIPPTPRENATTMAIGIPLTWLLGISCLLLTDIKFRRQLRDSVRQPSEDNVIPLRGPTVRTRIGRPTAQVRLRAIDRSPSEGSGPSG